MNLANRPPPLAPPPCAGEGSRDLTPGPSPVRGRGEQRPHPRPLSRKERGARALVGKPAQGRRGADIVCSEPAQAGFAAESHPGAVSTAVHPFAQTKPLAPRHTRLPAALRSDRKSVV